MTTSSYAESIPSLTSKTSKFSVYQTDGKPLSTEAIYRAKMKYGVYNNPAKVSLGVDPSASDTAAILAANTDLSIHAYHKDLSAEAAHAALIAKPEQITGWKREHIAPEAEHAALSARSIKMPFNQQSDNSSYIETEAAGAASAVLKKKPTNIARSQLQDIYDFDDVRSGKVTLSQFSDVKNNKSLKSLSTAKDYRSGISTSSLGPEVSRKMNIGNITNAAAKAAKEEVQKRITPHPDQRAGLKTSLQATNSNKDTSVFIQNIHAQAINASKKELNKTFVRNNGIPTASDKGLAANPAEYAAALLKSEASKKDVKETIANNSLVTPSIYAIAAEKAKKDLQKINDDVASKSYLTNIKVTEEAYKIAQENAEKRRLTEPGPGQIALGGGLIMKYNEIETMATALVQPAIVDMETKIVEMKKHDEERKKLPAKIKQREAEHKEEKRQAQLALERERAEKAAARREQLELDKKALDEEFDNFKLSLAGLLETRKGEFSAQVEEEEAKKTEINTEREEKLKVLTETKEAQDKERAEEFASLEAERDEDIAPLLEELEVENSKLKELTDDRVEKENIYNDIKSKHDSTKAELDDTLSKIETMVKRLEELESSVAEVTAKESEVTSSAAAAEALLDSEGMAKQNELESFTAQRKELESKREELHSSNRDKVEELKNLSLEHHEQEKQINEEFPEHLRKEVVAPKDIDDSDLADSKFELDDKSIEIPPEIEDEPEVAREEVWPKVEKPVETSEAETPAEVDEAKLASSPEAKSAPQKKTWDEVRKAAPADGSDPLASVPTQEKPAMVDVVTNDKMKESNNKLSFAQRAAKKLASGPTPKSASKTATAPKTSATPTGRSSEKKGGLFGLFRSKSKTNPSVSASSPKKTTEVKSTEKVESAPKKETDKKETTKADDSGATEESPEKVEKKTEKRTENVDDDVFSGFSQGSEVEN